MHEAKVTLRQAKDQKEFGQLKDDPLSEDGVAYIMKYSAEDTEPPLYKDINDKSYIKDRTKIDPYGPFMVGMVSHMGDIEPYPNGEVYRGVKADLRAEYPEGRVFSWHGLCSTTKRLVVLRNPMFCGDSGKRTIFAIKLTQGQAREITRYSLVAEEVEILLPPGLHVCMHACICTWVA